MARLHRQREQQLQGGGGSPKTIDAWRRRIVCICFAAEAVACLNRRNLSMSSTLMAAAANTIAVESGAAPPASFHLTDETMGELATVAALAYAVSKPLHSLLSDYVSSRQQLGLSLVGTGVCNVLLAGAASRPAFLLMMGLNGLCQVGQTSVRVALKIEPKYR
jgi:sugar phosphate permease